MRYRNGIIFTVVAVALATSTSHCLADWLNDLIKTEGAILGSLGAVQDIRTATEAAQYANNIAKYGTAVVHVEPLIPRQLLTYGGRTLSGIGALVGANQRRQEYNLSWGAALRDQGIISGSSMLVTGGSSLIMSSVVMPCVASGACAAPPVALGVATVAVTAWAATKTGQAVESAISWEREYEQLLASQQRVDELRARLADQKIQKLRAQRNTPDWQAQRNVQAALQKKNTAPVVGQPKSTTPVQSQPRSSVRSVQPYVYTRPAGTSSPIGRPVLIGSAVPIGTSVPLGTSVAAGGRSPGGVSLSRAAAMRMALDIDLEGVSFSDGQLVLAGRTNDRKVIDAGLFLTALRAACEQGDPFFSLDADDGKAWIEEGNRASQELWDRISNGFSSRRAGPAIQAISARRDYPQLWDTISRKYPNLKTRLVFYPEWLRETRFGEILYVADVLLKELAGGVPALPSSRSLRAATVDGYVSADARRLMRLLRNQSVDTRSLRLWFDFLPQTEEGNRNIPTTASGQRKLAADGNILDLSSVQPKMFVRIHDLATRQDLPGHDPDLDALSEDINARTDRYASAYDELRALTDVFRAYVSAVKVVQQASHICKSITLSAMPLLPSEKPSNALPEYHPSELFLTVAVRPGNQYSLAQVSSTNGGVSVRGKSFVAQELAVGTQTDLTRDMRRELATGVRSPSWRGSSGRQFVALRIDSFDQADVLLPSPDKTASIEEVFLLSEYGPAIDRQAAQAALPYAQMARNAYTEESNDIDGITRRVSDWKTVLARAGYSAGQIKLVEATGFFAAIYVNERTGAVTIAYRGGLPESDIDSSAIARLGNMDIQYKAAADLAWVLKTASPTNSLALTGYGTGGLLAAFAGEQSGINPVVTFNAPPPLFTRSSNPGWFNVGWVNRQ